MTKEMCNYCESGNNQVIFMLRDAPRGMRVSHIGGKPVKSGSWIPVSCFRGDKSTPSGSKGREG
ncbi:MAG: hypothetical protein AB1401_12645 [Thermodesulfobacteriota bacterium]